MCEFWVTILQLKLQRVCSNSHRKSPKARGNRNSKFRFKTIDQSESCGDLSILSLVSHSNVTSTQGKTFPCTLPSRPDSPHPLEQRRREATPYRSGHKTKKRPDDEDDDVQPATTPPADASLLVPAFSACAAGSCTRPADRRPGGYDPSCPPRPAHPRARSPASE